VAIGNCTDKGAPSNLTGILQAKGGSLRSEVLMKHSHKVFLRGLEASKASVWLVARWLSEHDKIVVIPPTRKAPRHEDWKDYADSGDIWVISKRKWKRIEVKGLGYDFTSAEDWPHRDFIVCAKHAWDRASIPASAFYYVNPAMTHMAMVNPSDREGWIVRDVTDGRHGVTQATYICSVAAVRFIEL
jgi:hypothetical protein